MLQTDVKKEVLNREKLKKLDTKIMQFQGEDEFKFGRNGKLISDQPYFGIYNLFRNEVEDIYPGCVGQAAKKKETQFIKTLASSSLPQGMATKRFSMDFRIVFVSCCCYVPLTPSQSVPRPELATGDVDPPPLPLAGCRACETACQNLPISGSHRPPPLPPAHPVYRVFATFCLPKSHSKFACKYHAQNSPNHSKMELKMEPKIIENHPPNAFQKTSQKNHQKSMIF